MPRTPADKSRFDHAKVRQSLAVALAVLSTAAGSSATSAEALNALDGHWQGTGLDIIIDSRRAQARPDRQLPFQWDAFNIRNVEGNLVVFTIGQELFIGQLNGDELALTSPGAQQPSILRRARRLAR